MLKYAEVTRSTFCYQLNRMKEPDKYKEIKEELEEDLQLDKSTINCEFITSKIQEKYSVSHNENRIYNHSLYYITISKLPNNMKMIILL